MYRGNPLICTICARGGSKGVLGKNNRILCGKPLIAWTIGHALAINIFDHVVISTDSDMIAEAAVAAGGEVFFKRSKELSSDTAAKIPVIRDAFIRSEEHYQKSYSFHVDLDATSPLREPEDILGSLDLFLKKGWDNLISGTTCRRSPYFNLAEDSGDGRVVLSKKTEKPIIRRQDSPKCYDLNGSIYIWKREALLTRDSVFLENTGIYVMPEKRSIDIDSEMDFQFVEYLLNKRIRGEAIA